MKILETEIVINQTPSKVWSVLTNFAEYSKWNTFIKSVKVTQGEIEKFVSSQGKDGVTLECVLEPTGPSSGVAIQPKLLTWDKEKHFSWRGHMKAVGLDVFVGVHHFELSPLENGTKTLFKHYEVFSGLLHKPILWYIQRDTLFGFNRMNLEIKTRAESL